MFVASWQPYLNEEFAKDYMQQLKAFLATEKSKRKIILPHSSNWFKAFTLTPFDNVKVVILGQDPYHGHQQAHGLCFSTENHIPAPPSLKNIKKELANDVNICSDNTDLTPWAKQGVLLLNSVLTVAIHQAGAHANRGWETFTDKIISTISKHKTAVVFLLWGAYAHKKALLIDQKKHLILTAPHPSPLSAHRGFFGCHHFSQTNDYLNHQGIMPIDWHL